MKYLVDYFDSKPNIFSRPEILIEPGTALASKALDFAVKVVSLKKIRAYKNGVLETYLYPMSTLWDKLKIGMNRNGGGGWYGYIDDFRIYNKPLTADEIEELYESYE